MTASIDPAIAVSPIIYVAGAIILVLVSLKTRDRRIIDSILLLSIVAGLVLASYTVLRIFFNGVDRLVYGLGGWPPPLGIVYIVDGYSAILAFTTSLIGLLIAIYSIGYFSGEDGSIMYLYAIMLILLSALTAIYYTGDLFNTFVMVELMAVAAYSLVAYRRNGVAVEASLKYGFAAAFAGIMFFVALGFIYSYMGSLSMPDLAGKAAGLATDMVRYSGYPLGSLTYLLAIIGLMYWSLLLESAVFPLHFWLPDAHSEAPSPVSALLSGLVVNAGLYVIIRTSYTVFDSVKAPIPGYSWLQYILLVVGGVGALYASAMMLIQDDVKRLIAYSTIMHMSLISMTTGLNTLNAVNAVLYHFIAHGFSKSLAFLSVGVLIAATGSRRISDLRGMARAYPLVSSALIIALLGLAGMPPLGTFPSKLLMIEACISAGNPYAAAIIVLSSALAGIAYFRIIHILVNETQVKVVKEVSSTSIEIALKLLSILVLAVGILLPWIYPYVDYSGKSLLDVEDYIGSVSRILRMFR